MQENPLLFHDGNAWVKKEGNPLFDVTMRSYRGLRACRTLFVRLTRTSEWYKKRRALYG